MTTQNPDCPNFKPSPRAAWMCDHWLIPVSQPGTPAPPHKCLNVKVKGTHCPTAGLRTKPRSNYQPSDDGEVT